MIKRLLSRLAVMLLILLLIFSFDALSLFTRMSNVAYAIDNSMQVSFSQSSSRTQSKTITIPKLKRISSASVNTGNVSYSINGETVTITVSNGSSSGSSTSSQYISSTSSHTGTTYPPSSLYYSSGGYSGSLSRYDVVNNGDYNQSQESRYFSRTHDNVTTDYYDKNGKYLYSTCSWDNSSDHPYLHISEDGYNGDIPRTGASRVSGPTTYTNSDGSYRVVSTWRGYYSGELTKYVFVWYDDYTGYYRGYIYGSTTHYYEYNVTLNYVTNSKPSVSIIAPTNNKQFSELATTFIPTISVSDPDGDTLTCKYYIDSEASPRDTRVISNTATAQTISFNSINLGELMEGIHTIRATITDGEEVTSTQVNIQVDKSNPQIVINSLNSTDTTVVVSGSATDNIKLHSLPYSYQINGIDSQWTDETLHTFSGLTSNTEYPVIFKARDEVGHIAEVSRMVYTKAQVPEIIVSNVGQDSIELKAQDSNPIDTQYLIKTGELYVGVDGTLSNVPSWIKLENDKINISGLEQNKSYIFTSKARNEVLEETMYGNVVTGTTLASPPEHIQFDEVTNTSIKLSWEAVDGAIGYGVEVDGNDVNNEMSTVYTHTNLIPETEHSYRVRIINNGGVGEWSGTFSKSTLPNPPVTPESIKIAVTKTEVSINWDEVAGAEGYEVEIDGIIQDNGSQTSYIHYGVQPDSTHKYRVRANNIGGESEWSDYITATTLPNPPNPPETFTNIITKNTIELSWESALKVDRYEIEVDGFIYNNGIATSYQHQELTPLTEHKYRVRGINTGGTGQWSEYIALTTYPYEPWIPENVMATADKDSIALSWYTATYATTYEVEIDGNKIVEVSSTAFEHESLLADTSHSYRVRAKNISGYSEWTNTVTISTSPDVSGSPTAITNVAAIVTSELIALSWDASAFECDYEIEVDGIIKNIGPNTMYNHTNLEPGTYHDYKIRPKNEELQANEWSVVLTLSTLPEPPGAPVITDAVSTNNSIQLWWESVEGAVSYDIEADGEIIANVSDITFINENLIMGTAHRYRVRARTLTDVSPWSEILEKSTKITTYEIECVAGEAFSFSLIALDVQDFTEVKYVVTYDETKLDIVDLCEFTPINDVLETGSIPKTNLLVKNGPGRIEFTVTESIVPGTSWSGELTSIKFRAKQTGTVTIDFNEE